MCNPPGKTRLIELGYASTLDIKSLEFNCGEFREIADSLINASRIDLEWPATTTSIEILAESEDYYFGDSTMIPSETRWIDVGGHVPESGVFIIDSTYMHACTAADAKIYRAAVLTLLGMVSFLRYHEGLTPSTMRRWIRGRSRAELRRWQIGGEVIGALVAAPPSYLEPAFWRTIGEHGEEMSKTYHDWDPRPGHLVLTVDHAEFVANSLADEVGISPVWVWRRLSCSRLFNLTHSSGLGSVVA